MSLPKFFLVGAPKAGTAAVYAALATHPEIFLPSNREPAHFLDERPPAFAGGIGPGDAVRARSRVRTRADYEALYADAPDGAVRGDGSTLHLADRRAHQAIADAVPDARLVAILRDPVERAYSSWTHLRSDGLERIPDFVEACAAEDRRTDAGFGPLWRYRALGRYGAQVAHLQSVFDPSQIHLVRYRDLVGAPVSTIDGICHFLGVAPGIVGPLTAENVRPLVPDTRRTRRWSAVVRAGAAFGAHLPSSVREPVAQVALDTLRRDARPRPPLGAAARREVLAPLVDDIRHLEALTGWDLADWLDESGHGPFTARRGDTTPAA